MRGRNVVMLKRHITERLGRGGWFSYREPPNGKGKSLNVRAKAIAGCKASTRKGGIKEGGRDGKERGRRAATMSGRRKKLQNWPLRGCEFEGITRRGSQQVSENIKVRAQ